jgi:hypothetical protein
MKNMMDIVKNVRAAQMGGAGNWIRQGRGVLVVRELGVNEGFKGQKFSSQMIVESSESLPDAEVTPESKGLPEVANSPGSSVSFICLLEGEKKKKDTAYKNMKTYLYKLLDESEESINQAAAERASKGEGPNHDQVPQGWSKEHPNETWNGDYELALILAKISASDQPLTGMAIRFETARVTTGSGKRITVVNWYTMQQTGEEIAARRARVLGMAPAPAA